MSEKLTLPISIVLAGLLIGGGIYLNGKIDKKVPSDDAKNSGISITTEDLKGALKPIDANDHILGSPDARIIVVEYSDTECPFCKIFHSTMLNIMQEYGNKGDVAWVYRHYPIAELHSNAPKQAEALECAAALGGNTKFWEYTNKIYEVTPSNNGLDMSELPKIAASVGLSSSAFATCLQSGEFAQRVKADLQNAYELDAGGTPYSILIDTKTGEYYPLNGAYPYNQLKAAIDLILKS